MVAGGLAVLPESTRPGAPPLDLSRAWRCPILSLGSDRVRADRGARVGLDQPSGGRDGRRRAWSPGCCSCADELRREHPLFDVRVLRRPVVAAGAIGIICAYFAFLGTLFLLSKTNRAQ